MDTVEQKIVDGLREIAKLYGGGGSLQMATVTAVDTLNYTCDVVNDDDEELPGILYKSVSGGTIDVVFEPAINSRVLIMALDESDQLVVLKCGAVANIYINCPNIIFNNGTLGGLVKVVDLVSKLNILEQDLNAIKTVFNTWVPVPSDGGAALKTAAAVWANKSITATVKANLENTKIKQ